MADYVKLIIIIGGALASFAGIIWKISILSNQIDLNKKNTEDNKCCLKHLKKEVRKNRTKLDNKLENIIKIQERILTQLEYIVKG